MSKNKLSLNNVFRRLQHRSVEYDINPYKTWLSMIEKLNLTDLTNQQLQNISFDLIKQVRSGTEVEDLPIKAFSIAREASQRILNMRPFDVQIIAGMAMHDGNMVEMQTGEGKTLVAVLPAYLNALSGKGVHVLTFNDYLAKRDAEWMGPVYRFLGLSVGYVHEGMSNGERQAAYSADITYLTAKEAGFDYLKGFLCRKKEELVQRPFHFAIIDEADSILIDEARIPLVIAGKTDKQGPELSRIIEVVRSLKPQIEYETDENERNIFLTDIGLSQVEEALKCGNLYEDRNLSILVNINNVLHAEMLLKRDVDYIVRNKKVELVDEFTGRVADKRHWPHGLQEAIEAKEGITSDLKGQIITSVTLQNFIRLYSKVCGMTGTAITSADELKEFYGLMVVAIPTNKPCIRVDYPDMVFSHKEAKYTALVQEIIKLHSSGRPILIGTCSVEESEHLAEKLKVSGVSCQVLNAKNDELEANVIAAAGAYGAVTVSTNMAGRGTDIKLGGEHEEEREKVVARGGLYVIGTNKHESRRIDNQLKGRAGRQGDPGSTKFFISLEDDLMKRYKIKNLIPDSIYPKKQEGSVNNPIIPKRIADAQRIIEGQNYDIRRTLGKYAIITEQQRTTLHKWRENLLLNRAIPCLMPMKLSERYMMLSLEVGEEALRKAEVQVTLHFINKCWAEYLDYMSYVRESIYLVSIGGKVPVDEFNRISVRTFEKLMEEIEIEIIQTLANAEITKDGIDMEKEGLKAPTSTWTYLVNDRPEQLGINPMVSNPIVNSIMWPLMMLVAVYYRFFRRVEKVD
jgi:preprotein translocase subunit SecA